MRIALVSPFTVPYYCGNSILAERLRGGLRERGYKVAVFNSAYDDPGEAADFSPEIIHSFNAERTYPWLRELKKKCFVPWVITLTGTDYNPWAGKKEPPLQVKESLESAHALVVFHPEALQSLSHSLPQLRSKTYVIPQGVVQATESIDRYVVRAKYGLHPHEVVFLMVSGIRPVKNITGAVSAFFEVERVVSNVSLLHVGPIMDKEEADRISLLGKDLKCFRMVGGLPPSEVRALMRAADVFLNTSRNEGMAGAILEGMAEGLPILASDVSGNRGLVRDGVNGLLFSEERGPTLREAAMVLALNESLRNSMGGKSMSLIAEHHSPAQELDGHERMYQGIGRGVTQ